MSKHYGAIAFTEAARDVYRRPVHRQRMGQRIGPSFAAAVARRPPPDFHPFIGNVVSMAASTATIVTALSVMPGFD